MFLIKIDQDGAQKWYGSYGKINHEVGYDVAELDDGGYLLVGFRNWYSGGKSILIIKTDSGGNQIWEKEIEKESSYDEVAFGISKSKSNGYFIFCTSNQKDNFYDPRVINIDFNGNIKWSKTFSGSGLKHTRWTGTATDDGGAAIVGTTNYYYPPGHNEDIYLLKIDHSGDKLWDSAIGGGNQDWGWAVIETFFRKLVVLGSTQSYGAGLYDIILTEIPMHSSK
jgi:hypothetical protein